MTPQLQDSFQKLTPAEIEEFESEIGFSLPKDYRDFLLEKNGGYFSDPVVPPDSYIRITTVYGLNTQLNLADLRTTRKSLQGVAPSSMLAIAGTQSGDDVWMHLDGPNRGCVEILVEDIEGEVPTLLAKSFSAFIESLEVDMEKAVGDEQDPAFRAIHAGDIVALRKMLDAGLDVEHRNDDQETLLMVAALDRRLEIIELVLKHGAKINATDNKGRTALFYALGGIDCLELLASNGSDLDMLDNEGETVLVLATRIYAARFALKLIDLGADVNLGADGWTPLRYCEKGTIAYKHIRPKLIEKGAKK